MSVARASRTSGIESPALRRRLLTLILGRVGFVVVLGVLLGYLHSGQLTEFSSPALMLMGAALGGTLLASGLYLVLALRLSRGLYWLAFVQIQLDLVLWGIIISLTGGVNSTFTFLFSLSIVIAAVYLGERGVIFTLVLSVAIYVLVVVARLLDWVPSVGSLLGVPTQPELTDLAVALTLDIGSMVLVAMLGWVLALQVTRVGRSLERTQEIFEDLHRLNEAIITLLPSGLVTTDTEGRIRSTNPAVEQLLGMGSPELVGRRLDHVMGGDHGSVEQMPAMGQATIARGGQEVSLEYMKAPLQDGTGRVIGSIVHIMDVTELEHMRQTLGDFEKYRALGDLAVGLAHEIRNPLGSISGSIELVREGDGLGDEDRRLLGIVQHETDKIGRLVTSLFNLARPPDPVLAPVDLLPLVEEIGEMFTRDREYSGCEVRIEIPAGIRVMADRDQLGQVVMNLVRNAAEASRDSVGSIVVGARELEDSLVEISITDSGRGVDPELLDKIYDPYFTTKSYGLGVGLALCRSMVERHGGTLMLENITGGGAVARIRLPGAP